MPLPVITKLDFSRRYKLGEFGNRAPTWDTLEEYLASDYVGLVHIRNRVASGPTWYNIPANFVERQWKSIVDQGQATPEMLYPSGMAPTEKTLFQGEVMLGPNGLDLFFTTVAKPMRDALKDRSERVQGVIASLLLKHYLCTKSYDWLMYLLETYPDHVVEFSTYSVCWGTVPGFNTVFWEIRYGY